jgi:hypothetical protein
MRRRHSLQVSTFPFLAVLLCTMGSLILLLLVIDRRARVVALVKARQAQQQTDVEEVKLAEARRAEWELRRRRLHQQLQEEDLAIASQIRTVERQAATTAAKLQGEQAQRLKIIDRLKAEQAQVAHWEMELADQKEDVARTARETEAARAEMAKLTADLERLERALADLKALRKRQQQMYSLVPYRGKRGDSRKPIYLECTAGAVIFHPDKLSLVGPLIIGGSLRTEIERRLAAQHGMTVASSNAKEGKAYLFLLLRPDGITTYYKTLAALQGLNVDFGYEFVDQEWVLDFPEKDEIPASPAWLTAEAPRSIAPTATQRKVTGLQPAPPGPASVRRQGVVSANGEPGMAAGTGASEADGLSPRRSDGNVGTPQVLIGPPTGFAPGDTLGGNGPGSMAATFPRNGQATRASDSPLAAAAGGGTENHGSVISPGNPANSSGSAVSATAGSGQVGPMSVTAAPQAGGTDPTRATFSRGDGERGAGQPQAGDGTTRREPATVLAGQSSAGGQILSQGSTAANPGDTANTVGASSGTLPSPVPQQAHGAGNGGTGERTAAQAEGRKANTADASSGILPALAPQQARGPGSNGTGEGTTAGTEGSRPASPGSGQDDPGEPGRPPIHDPAAALAPPNGARRTGRPAAFRPSPLNGNRDWIITVECTPDALLIGPLRQRITMASLASGENGAAGLVHAVQQIIARRQATVRPGEPPYRPMIRFLVQPAGLRSYYTAYPVLETLGLSMSRENLLPEDETRKALNGQLP